MGMPPHLIAARQTYRNSLDHVVTREELPLVLNSRGLVGNGVEIGVEFGLFSEHILRYWGGRLLISVDPWREQQPSVYRDVTNRRQTEQDEVFARAVRRLSVFGKRSLIWRLFSEEANAYVPEGTLDFAYIDARHDFDSVFRDLTLWFRKVKPHGILAGHDYIDGFYDADYGVKSAVDQFFSVRGVAVHTTHEQRYVRSWIVEVPG